MNEEGSTSYTVDIHYSPEHGYEAAVRDLPGCFAAGLTLEELYESLAEGIGLYLSTDERTVNVRMQSSREIESVREERVLVTD